MTLNKMLAAIFGFVVFQLAGCAHHEPSESARSAEWNAALETLEREATADSFLTAAFIHSAPLRDPSRVLDFLDRSLDLSPQQPDVAWLALNVCVRTPDCSVAPRVATLIRLDPRNAVAHYPALTEARKNGDVAAEDRALGAMADAEYFDVYWSRLITRTLDTLTRPRGAAQRPLREFPDVAIEVVGWMLALGIPSFNATANTCSGERLKRDDVVENCRKLARVLDNGDVYIGQRIGHRMALQVWPPDSADAASFRAKAREASYIYEAIRPFDNAVNESAANARSWLDRHRVNRRELDVYRQWLTDVGVPATPPSDWVPESERQKPASATR